MDLEGGFDVTMESYKSQVWLTTIYPRPYYPASMQIPAAITAGLITQADVARAAGHVLTMKFASGLFDQVLLVWTTDYLAASHCLQPLTDEAWVPRMNSHQQLALEAAEQSVILMKVRAQPM